MAALYRIIDWGEVYENSVSRQRQQLHWVPMPNKHDSDGYTQLVDHPNGAAHYGCWVTIVEVASKCRPRGCLWRGGGPTADRQPHDSASLARVTRLPEALFLEAIPRFLDPSIGWLEVVDTETEVVDTEGDSVGDSHVTDDRQSADSRPTIERKKERKKEVRFSEPDLELAKWMFSQIQTLQPDRTQPNFKTWANTIRLMRERDKRTPEDIRQVFGLANADDFWCKNILSPEKLRQKFDDLKLKLAGPANQPPSSKPPPFVPRTRR